MNRPRSFKFNRLALAVTLLAGAFGNAQAGDYSNVYFIGDSLTDSGTFRPVFGLNDHFSTNPGTVWSQNLGARYGLAVTPAYAASLPSPFAFNPVVSGNNFAVGSARINAAPTDPAGAAIPPMSAQVSALLARGTLDPGALYSLSGGHNDVFAQLSGGSGAQAAIVTAANDLTA